ncbi:MAG TPA: hypothetical protein VG713_17345, partial [Pirellulales bacterium]|nr:hypothetical protein [Pirellulales bacterium]
MRSHKTTSGNQQGSDRRGVILLVILGLLSLFMLVVVSFVMTAGAERRGASAAARIEQQGDPPDALVKMALYQVVRGSRSPRSVIGPHSLLEDMYGERESVSGAITTISATAPGMSANYTGAFTGSLLQASNGQLVELGGGSFGLDREPGIAGVDDGGAGPTANVQSATIYPKNLVGTVDDPGEYMAANSDDRPLHLYQPAELIGTGLGAGGIFPARIEGYFAGRVITMITGAAAGQSTHIVRWYDAQPPVGTARSSPANSTSNNWRMWIRPFPNGALPALGDRFVINGRPFNGTGFGYNAATFATGSTANTVLLDRMVGSMSAALAPNPIDPDQRGYYKDSPLFATSETTYDAFNIEGHDADEDYDIPDFNNMALAGMIANPNNGQWEIRFPSFHRPDLVYYWMNHPPSGGKANHWYDLPQAVRRRIILRPDPKDNNPNWNTPGDQEWSGNALFDPVNGPWDIDNDNDGLPDSIWLDLGAPVQQAQDGRLVKPLFAVLCMDLDGRLNLNAHGNQTHYRNGVVGTGGFPTPSALSPVPGGNDEVQLRGLGSQTASNNLYPEPLFTGWNGTQVAQSFAGALFAGGAARPHADRRTTPLLNRNTDPTVNWPAAHTGLSSLSGLAVGSGFSVADINLAPVLTGPNMHIVQSGSPFRSSQYRHLLEGKWDGNIRSFSGSVGGAPGNMQRPPTPGRYGEPFVIDTSGNGMAPSIALGNNQVGRYLHPPSPGLTAGVNTTAGRITGDDNYPPAPTGYLYNSLTDQRLARGDSKGETQGATIGFYGGAPPDPNGRLAVGIDLRGQPIYANPSPRKFGLDDSVDDPWELDLSRNAARGTTATLPATLNGVFSAAAGVTLTSVIDAPITPAELSHILRPRDYDTIKSNDRSDQLVFNEARNDFNDIVRQVTSEQWDVPMPNLEPTPEIRDALATSITASSSVPGLGIPATNLSFADLLRGKMMAVVRAHPPANGSNKSKQQTNLSHAGTIIGAILPALVDVRGFSPPGANTVSIPIGPSPGVPSTFTITRLISPELMLGLRMNLNRPLSDGVGSASRTATVPDVATAGSDPNGFLHTNDSTYVIPPNPPTTTQPTYIAVNPSIDNPNEALRGGDRLWRNTALDGGSGNGANFDATWDGRYIINSPNHSMCEYYGRQELAKHLYVLAMMMMDSNYTFPTAEPLHTVTVSDPATGAFRPIGVDEQKHIITAYRVAQWAINVVDFADRDTAMTPFEFDIYPFTQGNPYLVDANPDDGIDDSVWVPGGWDVDGVLGTAAAPLNDDNASYRGQVWGMEYPELLLTETLAFHDKGIADTDQDASTNGAINPPTSKAKFSTGKPSPNTGNDTDFDQVRIPQGSAFIELYCTGRGSAENYADPRLTMMSRELYDTTTPVPHNNNEYGALDLGRRAGGPDGSPVWRLAISKSHLGRDMPMAGATDGAIRSVPVGSAPPTASPSFPTLQPTVREMLYDTTSTVLGTYRPDTTTLQTGRG